MTYIEFWRLIATILFLLALVLSNIGLFLSVKETYRRFKIVKKVGINPQNKCDTTDNK